MTRKKKILIGVTVVVVIGLYAYVYRDWLRPGEMQISHRLSTGRSMRGNSHTNRTANVTDVAFGFNRAYKLTDVKVIPVAELATNQYAHPIWHLVSDSNSIPVKGFVYGEHIRGMRKSVKKSLPDTLETNVTYRLFVEAIGQKGHYDFKIGGKD